MAVTVPGRRLLNGGVLLGVGGGLGDAAGLRLRAGYEIAGPHWLLASAAVETDGDDELTAAVVVEAATPNLLFLVPSLGLGLGPVVDRRGGRTAGGGRVQATLSWPLVAAVLHVDVLPGQADRAHWALLGQLSF
jgi:hypothetical protein